MHVHVHGLVGLQVSALVKWLCLKLKSELHNSCLYYLKQMRLDVLLYNTGSISMLYYHFHCVGIANRRHDIGNKKLKWKGTICTTPWYT